MKNCEARDGRWSHLLTQCERAVGRPWSKSWWLSQPGPEREVEQNKNQQMHPAD